MYSIANSYGTTVNDIAFINQLEYPYLIVPGQALLINNGEDYGYRPLVYVNGYAYPFIKEWVLRETLPYLSYLSVFSYGFSEEGELRCPELTDEFMIEAAYEFGASTVLTLTPFDKQGVFNNNLIHLLLINQKAMDNLIDELITVMTDKGFRALDIDFEFILAEDKERFVTFVEEATRRMNDAGYEVFVALAPKTSDAMKGLLYEGKDYEKLGLAANAVLLMTYEWGYKYGPPLAVAPLDKVRQVVEYALTKIPAEKINLGIPNYAYDWPLPYARGETEARTIGNVEAVRIAIDNNAEILFDETAQTPYFNYVAEDKTKHVVWFEDVRSLNAKFNLVEEYSLRGMGYWTIMQWFRANWVLLEDRFRIIKQ